MTLRPYEVSQPFLMGEADPEVNYFGAIENFARPKLQTLAKRAIHQMQRFPASGIFESESRDLRSFWDEWCWYQHKYDSDCGLLSLGAEETLDSFLRGVATDLPGPEAVLLSCVAVEDQSHMPARDDDAIIGVLRDLVTEAASRRSMSRFEVW